MFHSLSRKGSNESRTYLGEIRCDNSSILQLPTRQRLQCFASPLIRLIFDKDLSDPVRLAATAAGAWDLHLKHFAVFLAFFLDVFADFCEVKSQYGSLGYAVVTLRGESGRGRRRNTPA